MKKRFLLMIAAMLTIMAISGCGGEKVPETANTDGTKKEVSETAESEVAEESQEAATADSSMAALISRFQGDWNGAMIFTDCVGAYEYLQDEWTSCLARFLIDEEGNIDPFIGLYVEDTPITNLKAWLDTDMECMMIGGEWITVPFETRVTEYNGTMNVVIDIENTAGSLSLVMNFRHLDDEGWTDEYPGLSPENVEYCKGKSFDELAVINGYEPGDYPETASSTGNTSGSAVDLGDKATADGHVELSVLKEVLPWMKTETDYGMPYEEIAAKFGVHGKYVDTWENNGEQFVRYRWSADDDNRITITFYANPDGSETWNVTAWDGID